MADRSLHPYRYLQLIRERNRLQLTVYSDPSRHHRLICKNLQIDLQRQFANHHKVIWGIFFGFFKNVPYFVCVCVCVLTVLSDQTLLHPAPLPCSLVETYQPHRETLQCFTVISQPSTRIPAWVCVCMSFYFLFGLSLGGLSFISKDILAGQCKL